MTVIIMNQLAQKIIIPGVTGDIEGPLPTRADMDPGHYKFEDIGDVVTVALSYLFPLAGFILFIYIVFAGFQWLTSMGDAKKIESAKNRLTYAVLGFVLLVAAYWITRIIEIILSPNQPFF